MSTIDLVIFFEVLWIFPSSGALFDRTKDGLEFVNV